MSTVSWILAVNVKDDPAFRSVMSDMIEGTRQEPGTVNYEWHASDDGSAVHIYERFTDADAAMAHLGNFGEHFAERFMGAVEPIGVWVYGAANDAVREALSPMGAQFYGSIGGFTR